MQSICAKNNLENKIIIGNETRQQAKKRPTFSFFFSFGPCLRDDEEGGMGVEG